MGSVASDAGELNAVVTADNAQEGANNVVVVMTFETEDAADETGAWGQVNNLKLEFDRSDVEFWFNQFQMHLATAGIKKQWSKRLLLHKMLPQDVVEEVKDLLRKDQASAGASCYKDLKERILKLYGKKPEDRYQLAKALTMTGKPSQLAKALINTVCPAHPYLNGCCAEGQISGMWRDQLPDQVRIRVANHRLGGGQEIMENTLDLADSTFASLNSHRQVSAVARADLDTSADAPALQSGQVAALRREQQKKKKSSSSGSASASSKSQRGEPHPDGPPPTPAMSITNTENQHTCRKKDTCPWAHFAQK